MECRVCRAGRKAMRASLLSKSGLRANQLESQFRGKVAFLGG